MQHTCADGWMDGYSIRCDLRVRARLAARNISKKERSRDRERERENDIISAHCYIIISICTNIAPTQVRRHFARAHTRTLRPSDCARKEH